MQNIMKIIGKNFLKKNSIDFIFLDDYHENYNDKFSIYKKLFLSVIITLITRVIK